MKWIQMRTSAMRPVEQVQAVKFGPNAGKPTLIREFRTIWVPISSISCLIEAAAGSEYGGVVISNGPTLDLDKDEVNRVLAKLGEVASESD